MASWTLESIRECEFQGGYSPSATAGDCWFDPEAARKKLGFFETYTTHAEGKLAGKPVKLEEWQANLIGSAFGWKNPNGTRRYRYVPIFVARKNGKSTIGAGLALAHLCADGEHGAEVYSAAGDRLQAGIIFRKASSMVSNNASLLRLCRPMRNIVSFPKQNSIYRALSADAKLQHGLNPSAVLFDELHVQPTRDLWDALDTATGARDQPMIWAFTTAGYDQTSICYEVYQHACMVRDGVLDDRTMLPAIWETKPEDDWSSPAVWAQANPNLGVSIDEARLAQHWATAKKIPSKENTFRQLFLNQWTQQAERWLPMDQWDATKGTTFTEAELEGAPCFVGLDLSATCDMTAMVALFAVPQGYTTVSRFYLPESAIETAGTMQSLYREWIRRGYLTVIEGNSIDQGVIRREVNALAERFDVRGVVYDPWAAKRLAGELGNEDGLTLIECRQGMFSLSEPSKLLEKLVADGMLFHNANPILRWHASNAAIRSDDNGNIKPDKAKATGKIDGIVALIMALSRVVVEGSDALTHSSGDGFMVLEF